MAYARSSWDERAGDESVFESECTREMDRRFRLLAGFWWVHDRAAGRDARPTVCDLQPAWLVEV